MIKKFSEIIHDVFGKKTGQKIISYIDFIFDIIGDVFGWSLDKLALYIRKVVDFLNVIFGQTGKLLVTTIAMVALWIIYNTYTGILSTAAVLTPEIFERAINSIQTLMIALFSVFATVVSLGITVKKVLDKKNNNKEES